MSQNPNEALLVREPRLWCYPSEDTLRNAGSQLSAGPIATTFQPYWMPILKVSCLLLINQPSAFFTSSFNHIRLNDSSF